MIIPDVNLLVYAYNRGAPGHERARSWLQSVLNGSEPVGFAWAAIMGFVRLLSNPAVVVDPVRPEALLEVAHSWLRLAPCRLVGPGAAHAELMARLFRESGAGYRMVTDIHLAALAMEHKATLCSNDVDFARFRGLRLKNPLA